MSHIAVILIPRLAPREERLPAHIAMPVILGLSLGLWVVIWKVVAMAAGVFSVG